MIERTKIMLRLSADITANVQLFVLFSCLICESLEVDVSLKYVLTSITILRFVLSWKLCRFLLFFKDFILIFAESILHDVKYKSK